MNAARRRSGLLLLLRLGLGGFGLLPFVPVLFAGVPLLDSVARAVESWFAFQCHREAARSMYVFGHVLPVCARCSGIYFGFGLGALVAWPRLAPRSLRLWVGLAALAMLLDVASELAGLRAEWMPLRLLTGIVLAYPVGSASVCAFSPARSGDGSSRHERGAGFER